MQILDILAEAQQAVPEQLRQYASVAGGGGGGALPSTPALSSVLVTCCGAMQAC